MSKKKKNDQKNIQNYYLDSSHVFPYVYPEGEKDKDKIEVSKEIPKFDS